MGLPQPFQFDRTNSQPLESSTVQADATALNDYLQNGVPYPGQILSVRGVGNTPAAKVVNEDLTVSDLVGGPGVTNISYSDLQQLTPQERAGKHFSTFNDPNDSLAESAALPMRLTPELWQVGTEYDFGGGTYG